jgi:hypothetical protein
VFNDEIGVVERGKWERKSQGKRVFGERRKEDFGNKGGNEGGKNDFPPKTLHLLAVSAPDAPPDDPAYHNPDRTKDA